MIQGLLFIEEQPSRPAREIAAAAQSWCDPKAFAEIVGVDFGGGCMCFHCLISGEEKTRIPYKKVVETFESFPDGTLVIAEKAHLGTPRTSKSLAQPFTEQDLRRIAVACSTNGKALVLFPHQHSRKAREWAAANAEPGFVDPEKDTDINDARALAFYVANNNGISLAKPQDDFSVHPMRKYGMLVRQRANNSLNAARTHGYDSEILPEISRLAADILAAVGRKDGYVDDKIAFTIASNVIVEVDGKSFRFTYQGKPPGVRFFMRDVLMFSPFHHAGGVGRSNMEWHRFRSWAAKQAAKAGVPYKENRKYIKYGAFTPEQEQFVRGLHKQVRREVRDAYLVAVELSGGLPGLEILDDHVRQNTFA